MSEEILKRSIDKAIGGGASGFSAMFLQVSTLMWLRTTMNYQYRYGGTFVGTLKNLYNNGGITRFYRGYPYALMMGPTSRFCDTASNAFVMSYLDQYNMPTSIKTIAGSGMAASCRVFLMPIDTLKTSMQVEGKSGVKIIKNKIKTSGPRILYNGTLASMSATFVGHYPWFLTYNLLNQNIPQYNELYKTLIRNASIGFGAAVVSDTCSNSLRVLKTTKQTHQNNISYLSVYKNIIEKEGHLGLMGRGLKTRILTNGIQGSLFVVLWKYLEKSFF
jgi:hypothetical protein